MPMPSETTVKKENAGERADKRRSQMFELARTIEQRADEPLTLTSLAEEVGLSPSRLQKVFKDVLGVSPKTYHAAARMRQLKQSLKQGSGVTDAIFQSGYGSVSRVYGEGKRTMGMTPTAYRGGGEGESISYAYRTTSLGLVMMAATNQGVCFVQFGDQAESLLNALQCEFPKAKLSASSAQHAPDLDHWIEALERHIDHAVPKPDIPLDIRGTAFQIKVWNFLQTIPEGSVLSYSDVANGIGKPKASRAVGSACGKNRIGLLVPCHRVLRGDGELGGYRWGLERKQALLAMESQRIPQAADQA